MLELATGMTSCVSGHEQNSCQAGTPGADDATCDGIDNNCNGQVDENYKTRATSCGVGACGGAVVYEVGSSMVAAMPRLSSTGLRSLPSSRSRLKFCMLRAPTWKMSE